MPPSVFCAAVKEVHPRSDPSWTGQQYVNPLATERLGDRNAAADKAAVAQAVIERWKADPEWPLDLEERVQELAAMIRAANDLA